ncbi:MAG: DUF6491 family protein [Woeseiaceae bacterium]|jgi:hypothetical protein
MLKQLFIILSSCFFVACAGSSEPSGGSPSGATGGRHDCIPEPSVRGYTVLDEYNLIVEASLRRSYHVVLQRRAYGLRNSMGIAFDSPSGRICSGFSEVVYGDSFGDRAEAVRIKYIRLLLPEEEEDLLIQFGLKEPEIKQTPVPREVEGADVEELDPSASE